MAVPAFTPAQEVVLNIVLPEEVDEIRCSRVERIPNALAIFVDDIKVGNRFAEIMTQTGEKTGNTPTRLERFFSCGTTSAPTKEVE